MFFNQFLSKTEFPTPKPCNVNIIIDVTDIIDIDENHQRIKLKIAMRYQWKDSRITVKNPAQNNSLSYFDEHINADQIWRPGIMFTNAIEILKTENPLEGRAYYYWGRLNLVETYLISVHCQMKFDTFPFDNHTCILFLQEALSLRLTLASLMILGGVGLAVIGKQRG